MLIFAQAGTDLPPCCRDTIIMDAPHCALSPVTQELAETLVKCKNIMSGFIPIMLCITTALYIIAGWIMFVNALRNFFVEIHLPEKDYAGDSTHNRMV